MDANEEYKKLLKERMQHDVQKAEKFVTSEYIDPRVGQVSNPPGSTGMGIKVSVPMHPVEHRVREKLQRVAELITKKKIELYELEERALMLQEVLGE